MYKVKELFTICCLSSLFFSQGQGSSIQELEQQLQNLRTAVNLVQRGEYDQAVYLGARPFSEAREDVIRSNWRGYNDNMIRDNILGALYGAIHGKIRMIGKLTDQHAKDSAQIAAQQQSLVSKDMDNAELKGIIAQQTENVNRLTEQNTALLTQVAEQNARIEQLITMMAQLQSQMNNPGPKFEAD